MANASAAAKSISVNPEHSIVPGYDSVFFVVGFVAPVVIAFIAVMVIRQKRKHNRS